MAEQKNTSSRSGGGKKAAPRRNDVIRCENCGEDYAVTYKRCPFCDERPGRGGYAAGGRRVANSRGGGYGGPVNPLQIIMVVISLVIIIAALFIVFKFISGPKTKPDASNSSVSTSQGGDGSGQGGASQSAAGPNVPGDGSAGDVSQPAAVHIQSITLNKSDITLRNGETTQLTAAVVPADTGAAVTWTSSDPNVLAIDEKGEVTNKNTGSDSVIVIVTASCGDASAQCIVRCKPQSGGAGSTGGTGTTGSTGSTGTVAAGSVGTIINAEDGLNVRSGPGRDYDVVASAPNGAQVTIQGEENGWYKIVYSGSSTGYVSKDYVSVK